MELISLASGSSGNCFYIEHNGTAILVDAGISAKSIVDHLIQKEKSPEKIQAIFITHEHIDHIRGADVLARKLGISIFATEKTIKEHFICSNENLLSPIHNTQSHKIDSLTITAVPKSHNAADPVSFFIQSKNKSLFVATDLGHICSHTKAAIHLADVLCLEANHDLDLLDRGPYPLFLKNEVRSDRGHLSNTQTAEGLKNYTSKKLSYVLLSHLSQTNNTHQIALDTISSFVNQRPDLAPTIEIAPRFTPTEIISI